MGNIVNRVFDSSGPEGKVRGTPQQIIDKYNQLARDAQLSNDRVAFENFQQHAEHYTRMLSEAQREQDQRREQQEREHEARRAERGEQRNNADQQPRVDADGDQPVVVEAPATDDVMDVSGSDTGLVETPESKPARPRRQRRPKQERTDSPPTGPVEAPSESGGDSSPEASVEDSSSNSAEAAE